MISLFIPLLSFHVETLIQNALIQQHQHQQQNGFQLGLGQHHSESESIQQQQQNVNTNTQNVRTGSEQEAAIALLTNLANAAHNNQRNL